MSQALFSMLTNVRQTLMLLLLVLVAMIATTAVAGAQPAQSAPSGQPSASPRPAFQGVAVLGVGSSSQARDDAFGLARAIYGSSLRPRALDELRARILAGDPAPPTASKEMRELAELRASIAQSQDLESAATRRLLASIARDLNVQALLVVTRGTTTTTASTTTDSSDAGASPSKNESDGGEPSSSPPPPSPSNRDVGMALAKTEARLFLAETGDFDAARYEPDKSDPPTTVSWRGTVSSLSPRFPPPPAPAGAERQGPAPKITAEGKPDAKPFYASPWLWAAVGAAVLIGGFFYFAAQDTSQDPIHLQMSVPR